MKLLVVDDESDIQFLFQQKFRKEIKAGEVKINFAHDGLSALDILESIGNDSDHYILTDINMPQMSGIELLEQIKNKYPKLKVIIITAYGDGQNMDKAKSLGVDDYFTKPLEFNLLKERLNKLGIT